MARVDEMDTDPLHPLNTFVPNSAPPLALTLASVALSACALSAAVFMKYPVRLSKKLSYRKENQYQTDKMVVVLINATAGVGKQTIAKALQELWPAVRVFTNHLLIDAAAVVFEREDPLYRPLRKALRKAIFDGLIQSRTSRCTNDEEPTPFRPIIFTEFTGTGPYTSESSAPEYLALARELGVPFISVRLRCETEENMSRLTGRAEAVQGTDKLLDPEIARFWLANEETYTFGDKADEELTLDVTHASPQETARVILKSIMEHIS